jgi:hypothetical protein
LPGSRSRDPDSAVIYAPASLIRLAFATPAALKNIGADLFLIVAWVYLVPSCGGFVPQIEGDVGARINLYPGFRRRRA